MLLYGNHTVGLILDSITLFVCFSVFSVFLMPKAFRLAFQRFDCGVQQFQFLEIYVFTVLVN